jgi:hypothetical protein
MVFSELIVSGVWEIYLLKNHNVSRGWVSSPRNTCEFKSTCLMGQVAEDAIKMRPKFAEGSGYMGENNLFDLKQDILDLFLLSHFRNETGFS